MLQELEDISYNTLVARLTVIQASGLLVERKIGKPKAHSLDLPVIKLLESRQRGYENE